MRIYVESRDLPAQQHHKLFIYEHVKFCVLTRKNNVIIFTRKNTKFYATCKKNEKKIKSEKS